MNKTVFSVLKWASVSGVLLVAMSCRRATPGLEISQLVKTAEVQKYDGECSTDLSREDSRRLQMWQLRSGWRDLFYVSTLKWGSS